MVWSGLRGGTTKTVSGIDFDIAKSALQKYIRRNIPEKALLAAIEIYRLGEVGGGAGVTNLFNRVSIIAAEDVGISNLPLVLSVIKTIESGDRDLHRLMAMIQLLCCSSKTRLTDQVNYVYGSVRGRKVAQASGISLDGETIDSEYVEMHMNDVIFDDTDPLALRPYVLMFQKRIAEKDFNAFSWVYFLELKLSTTPVVKKRNKYMGNKKGQTTKSIILLWRVLSTFLDPVVHDILVEAAFNHIEYRPFLGVAILIAINNLTYVPIESMVESMVEVWRTAPVLKQMLRGEFTLVVDDYVIDKHTAKGRMNGTTITDFVNFGALIIPEDERYRNKELERIYQAR
jgi:hypothetical protein